MNLKSVIILVLAVALIVINWWWFSKGKDILNPHIEIASFHITDIDSDRIKMVAIVVLNNRLPLKVKINRLEYVILVDSVPVLKSTYSKPVAILSGNKTVLKLPMEALAKPMDNVLKQFKRTRADSASYTFVSAVYVELPVIGERKFNFKKTVRGPAVQLYQVKVEKLRVAKFGFDQSELHMDLIIENPGLTHFKASEMHYYFTIGNELNFEGRFKSAVSIPPKQVTVLEMELIIKTLKFGKLAWKRVVEKKDMPFKFSLHCKVIAGQNLLDHTNVTMDIKGTLNELK